MPLFFVSGAWQGAAVLAKGSHFILVGKVGQHRLKMKFVKKIMY